MLVKTRAIVLHSIKFKDSQQIVDMLTEEQGRISFICHVSSSKKGKYKKQFFQPLTLLVVEYDYRSNSKLQHLQDIAIEFPYCSVPFDAFKLAISMFMAEFLLYATRDEQQNIPLFSYIHNSMRWLDGAVSSFSNFHLVFMMKLSLFLGFYPNLEDYHPGDIFDLRNACFSSLVPIHKDYVSSKESSLIALLMRLSYKTMHLYTMSREERNHCTEVILLYYRLHIPGFPELKSIDVLKSLFV